MDYCKPSECPDCTITNCKFGALIFRKRRHYIDNSIGMGKYIKLQIKILIFFSSPVYFSQIPEEYNKIYTKTYLETSQKDLNLALKTADSLYEISATPRFKAKSLMLSATLTEQSGDPKRAIDYAIKAEEELRDTDELLWRAKIFGFLSTQYRIIGFLALSKKYIDKTKKEVSKLDDPNQINNIMGFILQEQAYFHLDKKSYKASITDLHKARYYIDNQGQNNSFLKATNDQLLGKNYYNLKIINKALFYYKRALIELNKMPDNFMKGLVYSGLAQVYIGTKRDLEAKKYIELAEQIANKSNYQALKSEVYQTAELYYIYTNNIGKVEKTKEKRDSLNETIADKAQSVINESYANLEKKTEAVQQENEIKSQWILYCFVIILIGLACFFFYRKKKRLELEKIKKILTSQAKHSTFPIQESDAHPAAIDIIPLSQEVAKAEQVMMTPLTERRLLEQLTVFENSELFTRSTMSLPFLASHLGTNTKYLSYIINTHKKQDFKNYINDLRINYIIEKLKNEPKYQKYKISALAIETGFSTQSKFAAAFKKVTDVTPSQFLRHLSSLQ